MGLIAFAACRGRAVLLQKAIFYFMGLIFHPESLGKNHVTGFCKAGMVLEMVGKFMG